MSGCGSWAKRAQPGGQKWLSSFVMYRVVVGTIRASADVICSRAVPMNCRLCPKLTTHSLKHFFFVAIRSSLAVHFLLFDCLLVLALQDKRRSRSESPRSPSPPRRARDCERRNIRSRSPSIDNEAKRKAKEARCVENRAVENSLLRERSRRQI